MSYIKANISIHEILHIRVCVCNWKYTICFTCVSTMTIPYRSMNEDVFPP